MKIPQRAAFRCPGEFTGEGTKETNKTEKIMDMNRLTKQVLAFTAGIIVFLMLLGYAGSIDYAEQVVSGMSRETYEAVASKTGTTDNRQIVKEYMSNKEYYDSINK